MASDVCVRLQLLMEERKVTQADLARRLGVSRTTVHQWYWGINEPSIDRLKEIRRILGCTWEELIGR